MRQPYDDYQLQLFYSIPWAVCKFKKDEISVAGAIEDISRTASIKEVGLREAKMDDIIRTAYHQGEKEDTER